MLLKTCVAGLLLVGLQSANADTLNGYAAGIIDGNNLTLVDSQRRQHQIRIVGIYAPERVQPFGAASHGNLAKLAFNKPVSAECQPRNRHGELRCKVFVDGQDLGLRQITDGMAWWFKEYAREQSAEDIAAYRQAETMAKMRRTGLWSETNPTPPWDWQKLVK